MPDLGGLIQSVTYTGIGMVVGPLLVALVQSRGKKSESRATAADLISNAASGFVDRLNKDNKEQHETIRLQRQSLVKIIDVVDTILDTVPGLDDATETKIRRIGRLARAAL